MFSVDASYAVHSNSRSHSGLHVTLGGENDNDPRYGGPIWCRSLVQRLVSQSSFESEINAVHQMNESYIVMRSLMSDFGFDQSDPSILLQDNQATIGVLIRGSNFKGRAKHVNVRVHVAHQLQEAGAIVIVWVKSEDMQADALTKNMHGPTGAKSNERLQHDY